MKARRILPFFLVILMFLSACSENVAERWQEQYDLGVRYLSEGNYQDAIIAFTAAIEIDSKEAPAYIGRGNSYLGMSRTGNLSIMVDEDTADKINDLQMSEPMEDWQICCYLAQMDFEKALELDDSYVQAYIGLADVYFQQGGLDNALEILEIGIENTVEDQQLLDKKAEIESGVAHVEVFPGDDLHKIIQRYESDVIINLKAADYDTGYGLILSGHKNITIRGQKGTRLISPDGGDTILRIENCENITLSDLTLGHDLPNGEETCSAGVLWMLNSEVDIQNCDIFGCGKEGIYSIGSTITATNSIIRDCSDRIMGLSDCVATFRNCVFSGNGYNNPYHESAIGIRSFENGNTLLTMEYCTFTDNMNPLMFNDYENERGLVTVSLENCTFSGNTWDEK